MGFSKISADADFGGGVWHIIPSGEHREWTPLEAAQEADENDADDAEDLFDASQLLKKELKEQKK